MARGAQVRARARWAEECESSTAYLFRLEKKRATDRYISAIRMVFEIFCVLSILISLLRFRVILLLVLSFFLIFLLFFPSMIARPVRASSARGSVLLLFKVGLVGRPLAATAFPWNFV